MTPVEAWITRLRSGHLKQTHGVLGRPDGSRCCLGVACDIGVEYGIIPPPTVSKHINMESADLLQYGRDRGLLPEAVRDFLGLASRSGVYKDKDGRGQALYTDNDNRRLTFAEIADIIESRPEGLFKTEPTPSSETSTS